LLATLRTSSTSSLQESSEAVPVVDSSTASTDVDPPPPTTCHEHVSQESTRIRLLTQLLAGNSPDGFSGTEAGSHGTSVTSVLTSQSVAAVMQTTASSELSEDLSSVSVTDLFSVPDSLAANQNSKLNMEDQLLMAHLEQAIMNSELSLEDLDHLLAVSSSTDAAAGPASTAGTSNRVTDRQFSSHHQPTLLGNLDYL